MHFCSPICPESSINKYVIFKQKNKNNPSPVHIHRGEIGRIRKKLEGWDHILVDFSITVPPRFQKFNTKALVDKAFNEGIIILEEMKTKN